MRGCDFPECDRKHYARGWCDPHYQQARKGNPMKAIRPRSLTGRMARYVTQGSSDECWLWNQPLVSGNRGYAQISVGSKMEGAHRAAWRIANGEIPFGLQVLHTCDVRHCCNPAHLFLGTNADNVADRTAKKRSAVLRGETNGHAKVTEAQVREIREASQSGVSYLDLSIQYSISHSAIAAIVTRKTWAHI